MNPLAVLMERIRQEIDNLSGALSGGCCKDYSDYVKLVGQLDGLRWTEQQIIDLNNRLDADLE